jgi:hypothetical protein
MPVELMDGLVVIRYRPTAAKPPTWNCGGEYLT